MSNQKNNISGVIVFAVLMIALVSTGSSYAFYQRLIDRMDESQLRFSRLEQKLQRQIIDNHERLNYVSKQRLEHTEDQKLADSSDTTVLQQEAKIIKQINDQNRLIGKLIDYYKSMQQEITKIKRHDSAKSLVTSSDSASMSNDHHNDSELEQKPITIEDLDQEIAMSNDIKKEIIHKAESVFQTQSEQGTWGPQTNLKIQNAVENIRNTMQYTDLGVNNIDCKGSMCKVELVHRDTEQLEKFDLALLLEMSAEQPITATTDNKDLADGTISTTYYLSAETN